jgi:ribosomal-protein-alanine N-acetyltransferase
MARIPLPDPPLSDGVVTLRPWEPEDAPALVAGWEDPDVQRWTGVPDLRDEQQARRWIEGTPTLREGGRSLDLLITDAQDHRPLGEVGLTAFGKAGGRDAEVGWWVLPEERGRGVAARAVDLLTTWALAAPLHLSEVIAWVDAENTPSQQVAERAAFTRAGATGERWSRTRPA